MTDRRTDRRTDILPRYIRAMRMSCAVKIVIFTYPGLHFLFAPGTPGGNHAKRCMNEKTIQCLQTPCSMYPLPRWMCPSNYNRFSHRARYWSKTSLIHTILAFDVPVWCRKTRIVWLPDSEKNSKISLFVLAQLTNVTDRRIDRQTPHAGNSRFYAQHRTANPRRGSVLQQQIKRGYDLGGCVRWVLTSLQRRQEPFYKAFNNILARIDVIQQRSLCLRHSKLLRSPEFTASANKVLFKIFRLSTKSSGKYFFPGVHQKQ